MHFLEDIASTKYTDINFLVFCLIVQVPLLSILRIVLYILLGGRGYLVVYSFDEISAAVLGFEMFSRSS